jgi:asparagine synthase (glutamine-hydrolysing)
MCAIAGLIGPGPPDLRALEASLVAMRHRGPDDSGVFLDAAGGLALGHNRLAIIDPSEAAAQPMVDEDSGDALSFNGEIYNFEELRAELTTKGAGFRSRSDTEVLLRALQVWGLDALARLQGMFAFALWRPRERALYLARDPMGMKPLYWRTGPQGFAFASEIGGLIAGMREAPPLDRRALAQFLEFGYTFEAERTCLTGVRKLPPGCYLKLDAQTRHAEPARYWRPDSAPRPEAEAERAIEELHETLSLVVRQHLVADAPVGLLLSGGLDSSLLAAIASRGRRLKTLTMGFSASSLDERANAAEVAAALGTEHEEIVIAPQDMRRAAEEAARHFDDLFADWGLVSTRLLYQKARERGLKVVIVGEGADELFGGYDIFDRTHSRQPQRLWLWRLYRAYSGRRWGRQFGQFRDAMGEALAETGGDRFAAIRWFETRRQLPNNYVQKVDKASMSVSVEARAPFLDRRVAEIAYRMPQSMLRAGGVGKLALRRLAERFGLLPADVLARRKLGGGVAADWMDDAPGFRAFARERLLEGRWTRELGLAPAMRAYFVDGRAGYPFPHGLAIFRNLAWRLLILELWSDACGLKPHVGCDATSDVACETISDVA